MTASDIARSHSFAISAPCQLFAHVPGAHLAVSAHDTNEITVAIDVDAPEEQAQAVLDRLNLKVREIERTVRIQTDTRLHQGRASWWRWQRDHQWPITVTIQVPRQTNADLQVPGGSIAVTGVDGQLTIECAGGTVAMNNVAGRLDVKAFNGSIAITDFTGPMLSIRSAGRSIELDTIDAEDTRIWAASAKTTLQDVQGSLALVTHGGTTTGSGLTGPLSVDAQGGTLNLHPPPAPVNLHAPGSDVTLHLSHACRLEASAHDLEWDAKLPPMATRTPRHVAGPLFGGGPLLEAAVVGGRLALTPKRKHVA